MAEYSGWWTTGGTKGDQQTSYDQTYLMYATKTFAACSGFEGVAAGRLNCLAGTVSGANTVAINTGYAVVDGKFFYNSASQDVNIPSADGGNTRIDRIVLRADWANFNVSVTRIAGTQSTGTPSAPAITQTSGTTYDIMLYQALVDSAGTVTITDERVYASRGIVRRQGGSATVWATGGTTNYDSTNVIIQIGACTIASGGYVNVTFPKPFANHPLVIATAGASGKIASVANIGETGARVFLTGNDGTEGTGDVYWMAIGPAVVS